MTSEPRLQEIQAAKAALADLCRSAPHDAKVIRRRDGKSVCETCEREATVLKFVDGLLELVETLQQQVAQMMSVETEGDSDE